MPSINLAPGTQYIIAARKRRIRLYAIAVLVIAVFCATWASLYTYQVSLAKADEVLVTKIQSADEQIQTLHNDAVRVALFEKRLTEVQTLLDSHANWEVVFSDLQRLLPADTVLTSFDAASDTPIIAIQGTTTQIDQVSVAVASLAASEAHPSIFTSGSVKNVQRQEQTVGDQTSVVYSFTINLTFDPKALWQ